MSFIPSTLSLLHWCIFTLGVIPGTFAGNLCSTTSPTLIQIPLQNIALSDQNERRGIALSLGSPAQDLAFVVSAEYSHIYVDDGSSYCTPDQTPIRCAAMYGGSFNTSSSSSWSQAASFESLRTKVKEDPFQDHDVYGTDTLHVNSTLALQDFPLGLFRTKDSSRNVMNLIGLGGNSTFLSTLYSTGSIISRSWSYFQGWTGAESQYQMDGSLVLGGYDAAKVGGKNISVPIVSDPHCLSGLLITVTDIKMNLRNGSNISILGSSRGSAMRACIAPDYPLVSLPIGIWDSFVETSGVTPIGRTYGIHFGSELISRDNAYDGDLTITVSPSLDITIPNHQLVLPNYDIDSTGLTVKNDSYMDVLIGSLQGINLNDLPLFGRLFLTSAYLLVDYDRGMFTVWKSNEVASQDLIATRSKPCSNSSSPVQSSISSSPIPTSSASTVSRPSVSGHSISKAAIGGIVASAAFVGFIVIVMILLLRRWRARPRAILSQGATGLSAYRTDYFQPEVELSSDMRPLQELPLVQDQPNEIPPYELPTPRTHS